MSRVEQVYDWYNKNQSNDPNLFELVEVLCESSQDDIDSSRIEALVNMEVARMRSNGIVTDEEDSLVRFVREVEARVLQKQPISAEYANYAKKVAGVAFWLKQDSRGKEQPTSYSNYDEYRMLLRLENDFENVGEMKSSALRELSDFIAGSYQEVNVPRKQSLPNYRVNLSSLRARQNAMIEDVLPYIYPQEARDFANHWETGGPLVESVNAIIDLEVGVDPKVVLERLEESVDAFGLGFAKSIVIRYSKVGPDFAESLGEKMDEKMINYINDLRVQKEKYRRELETIHLSNELEAMMQEPEEVSDVEDVLEVPISK